MLVVEHDGTEYPLSDLISQAEIIVNGIFQETDAPILFVSEEEMSILRPGCLIIDVSCDEGMGFPFATPTTFQEPMLEIGNVSYYAVDHTPSYLWDSASRSISAALIVHLPTVVGGTEGWQENETIWSVRVAGAPDPFPLADGQHFVLFGTWASGSLGNDIPEETGEETQYLGYSARATSGQWNLEDFTGSDFQIINEYDIIGISSPAVSWLGFAEDDSRAKDFSEYFFTAPLVSVELPLEVGNTWDSSASVTFPDGTADAVMDGEVISYGDLPIEGSEGFDIYWSDAWEVETDLTASAGGEPFTHELRTAWYVPGVGMIREVMREEHLDLDDDPGWEESDLWLVLDID